ncbi:hypothetical protein JOL79_11625 [Microbispora sp. RL4-1S]|uniref:Uncharacterized protein n=1 Tax=Microbispora oryzae TaxID=2806554 RepID=A0A940WF38_9ACTN|nr:hypothetical protein [Microbispora oryzae]MBP2704464.1 hypothetical protein [Microbispora oryzae]
MSTIQIPLWAAVLAARAVHLRGGARAALGRLAPRPRAYTPKHARSTR